MKIILYQAEPSSGQLEFIKDLSTISSVSESRNRILSMISGSGSRNVIVVFRDYGPFLYFLDPETARFLQFLFGAVRHNPFITRFPRATGHTLFCEPSP